MLIRLKAVSGIMLTLLLIGMLTLAFNIQRVKAGGAIYIRADGSIEPSTTNITSVDNITYTFTGNNYDSIVVERDNIVIDGAGHTLQGAGVILSRGIYLTGRSNVTIKNVEIKAHTGIYLFNSSNNIIIGNIITANDVFGIWLDYSSNNNDVSENDITKNGIGIWFYESSGNNVYRNHIANNNCGIRLCACALNNRIYCNNFVDNTDQVYSWNSINVWDDGYPSGGNFWSDYTGVDYFSGPYQNETGSDGIGDTPYVIDENNQDNYPLMNPWTPTPPVIIATVDIDPDTLNLKSKGKWITCYIELPEGYDVADIDRAMILLNGTIPVDPFWVNKPLGSVVGDYDYDDVPDLMVKFDRKAVSEFILCKFIMYENVTLIIAGELYDGTLFEGSDIIEVKLSSDMNSDEDECVDVCNLVLPEFPSFLILPLFMIATLLAVIFYRRKHSM